MASEREKTAKRLTVRAAPQVCRWAMLPACLVLWGCPEQIGPNATGGTGSKTSVTSSTPATAPTPKPEDVNAPLAFRGTLSFGGTFVMVINQPEAGKATIRFEDSPFGLKGAIVGDVRKVSGRGGLAVTALVSDGSDPPPEAVIEALPRIGVRFGIGNGALRGEIEGLPNVALAQGGEPPGTVKTRHPGSAILAGTIHAVATESAPPLASIAGTYTYMSETARYPARYFAPLPGSQSAQVGQLRIESDGKFRACPNQVYAEACEPVRSGDAVMTAEVRLADQTRHPGQFEVWSADVLVGRLFAQEDMGKWNLRMAQQGGVGNDTVQIGSWIMQATTQPLAADALDGKWRCIQPALDLAATALNPPVSSGMIDERDWILKGGGIASDDHGSLDSARLTFNAGFAADANAKPAPLPGVVYAFRQDTQTRPGTGEEREEVILPLDDQSFAYLREVDGKAESTVAGLCYRRSDKRPGRPSH